MDKATLIDALRQNYADRRNGIVTTLLSRYQLPMGNVNFRVRKLDLKNTKPVSAETEDNFRSETLIPLVKIFDSEKQDEPRPLRILIFGSAGTGKTLICQNIAFRYGQENLFGDKYKIIFWLKLNCLLLPEYQGARDLTLEEILYQQCARRLDKAETMRYIRSLLNTRDPDVVLLLDGFDEVAHLMKGNSTLSHILREALEARAVLLTTRPHHTTFQENISFDRHLENAGFGETEIKEYVNQYFDTQVPPQPEAKNALLRFFEDYSFLKQSARVPLLLSFICDTWQKEQPPVSAVNTVTDLYQQISGHLFRYGLKREEADGLRPNQDPIDDNADSQWVRSQYESEMACFEEIAFESRVMQQTYSDAATRRGIIEAAQRKRESAAGSDAPVGRIQPIFPRLLRVGLFKTNTVDAENEADKNLEYIHASFQEFFAARYILMGLLPAADPAHRRRVVEFIKREKYNPYFRETLRFAAGLLAAEPRFANNPSVVIEFWNALLASPSDLTGWNLLGIALPCLEESRGKIPEQHQKALSEIINQWLQQLPPYDVKSEEKTAHTQFCVSLCACTYFMQTSGLWARLLEIIKTAEQNAQKWAIEMIGRFVTKYNTQAILTELLDVFKEVNNSLKAQILHMIKRFSRDYLTPEVHGFLGELLVSEKDSQLLKAVLDIIEWGQPQLITPAIIHALVTCFNTPECTLHQDIFKVLKKAYLSGSADEIAPFIIKALSHGNEQVQVLALGTLKEIPAIAQAPGAHEAVCQILDNGSESAKYAAVQITNLVAPVEARPAMVQRLAQVMSTENQNLQFVALKAIARFADIHDVSDAKKILQEMMFHHPDREIRDKAAEYEGARNVKNETLDKCLTEVQKMLVDAHPQIRRAGAMLLIGQCEGYRAVAPKISQETICLVTFISFLLLKNKQEAINQIGETLCRLCFDPEGEVREAAMKALTEFKYLPQREDFLPHFLDFLIESDNEDIYRLAWPILNRLFDTTEQARIIAYFRKKLTGGNQREQDQALIAIKKLHVDGPPMLEMLLEFVLDRDENFNQKINDFFEKMSVNKDNESVLVRYHMIALRDGSDAQRNKIVISWMCSAIVAVMMPLGGGSGFSRESDKLMLVALADGSEPWIRSAIYLGIDNFEGRPAVAAKELENVKRHLLERAPFTKDEMEKSFVSFIAIIHYTSYLFEHNLIEDFFEIVQKAVTHTDELLMEMLLEKSPGSAISIKPNRDIFNLLISALLTFKGNGNITNRVFNLLTWLVNNAHFADSAEVIRRLENETSPEQFSDFCKHLSLEVLCVTAFSISSPKLVSLLCERIVANRISVVVADNELKLRDRHDSCNVPIDTSTPIFKLFLETLCNAMRQKQIPTIVLNTYMENRSMFDVILTPEEEQAAAARRAAAVADVQTNRSRFWACISCDCSQNASIIDSTVVGGTQHVSGCCTLF